jgi:chromosome segregation ATPase
MFCSSNQSTALKERIDHLTRLILVSGSPKLAQLATVDSPLPLPSVGDVPAVRLEALNSELLNKDMEINRLQVTIRDQRKQLSQYLTLITMLQLGETERALEHVRDVSGLIHGSESSIIADAEVSSDAASQLKRRNRELEIVIDDCEERLQLADADAARSRAAWETTRQALDAEVHDLKKALADVRARAQRAELDAFAAAEAHAEVDSIREQLAEESKLRREDGEAHTRTVQALESDLVLLRSELTVLRLSSLNKYVRSAAAAPAMSIPPSLKRVEESAGRLDQNIGDSP